MLAATSEAERPSEANNESLATCRYVAPRGGGVVVLVVGVSRENWPAGFRNAKRMEGEGFETQPVSGVGDDAFWVGDPLHTLYVLKGTAYPSIGGDVRLEQARTLALCEPWSACAECVPLAVRASLRGFASRPPTKKFAPRGKLSPRGRFAARTNSGAARLQCALA